MNRIISRTAVALTIVLARSVLADAAEIRVWTARAIATVLAEILTTPGVDLVGPLPPEIQSRIMFAAGVSTGSKVPDAAMRLLDFLIGPVAGVVIRAQGMEPAR